MNKEFLPIGSVCLLKDAKKKVMITGFCVKGNETGDRVFDYLGCIYPTVGYCSEKIYIYLATNYVPTQTNYDEDELIEIHYIPLKEVVKMISNGEIKDAKTIAAIMYYISR